MKRIGYLIGTIAVVGLVIGTSATAKDLKRGKTVQITTSKSKSPDIPHDISYHGYLEDASGNPVNGTKNMEFKIFDAQTGGTQLWSDSYSIPVTKGRFSVVLTGIPSTIFTGGTTRYLEVKIETEILPERTKLTSMGWGYLAEYADDADKVDGHDAGLSPDDVALLPAASDSQILWYSTSLGEWELTDPQAGPKGDQGIQGIQGVKGDDGDQGIQGIPGVKGDDGDQGIQGIPGVKGDDGDQGIQGIQGVKGDDGDQGIQGIQGVKGDDGDQGIQGIQGVKGDDGDQGIQGIQGPEGPVNPNADMVDGYHAGNSSGQVAVSNGTKCTNLNADKLDGYNYDNLPYASTSHNHDSRYYTESESNSRFVNDNTGEVGASDIASGCITQSKIASGSYLLYDGLSHTFGTVELQFLHSTSNPVLKGTNTGSGNGIYGYSGSGYGVYGKGNSTSGVYGLTPAQYGGVRGSSSHSSGTGIVGLGNNISSATVMSSGSGVAGNGTILGVYGKATGSSGNRNGGYFTSNGGGWAYVGGEISGTDYKIYGYGNVSTIMSTREGKKVLFAPECPEPYFEDFGQEQLVNGHAHVELAPLFTDCIKTDAEHPMKVFIQLNDDCNGVYVKTGATGFDVYELQNGKSNASFTYRVVANRKDTDYVRLPVAVKPEEILKGR